jgi:integrase/recombinase XerD
MPGQVQHGENLELLGGRYRQYLEVINRSMETVRSYTYHLRKFMAYLLEMNIRDVQDVTTKVILDYQKHCYYFENRNGCQDTIKSQNNHLKVVKDFFRFLQEEDYLAHNPAKDVVYAKEPKMLPKIILTKQEVRRIIQQPKTDTLLGYRDRIILEVFYSTGIRRDELRNLKVEDVDYEEGYLRVNQGKGDKDRVVPLGKIACRYVENYIKGVRPELSKPKRRKELFLSKWGNRMGKNTIGELVVKYARRANIKKKVTCHTFRHSCATHMVRNKASIRHVQEMLGHKSLETTQKYIQLTITDLKEAHKKYHPRERQKE